MNEYIAIHLDRTINESWKFNKETEFQVRLEYKTIPVSGFPD
jgi:aspartyl aminopeptidase